MFEIIDSLIATVTVVLLLSLIVQSIQQVMKQLLSMKSKFMERELLALFLQVPSKKSWLPNFHLFDRAIKEHPNVKELIDKIRERLSGLGYNDIGLIEGMSKDEFLKIVGNLFDTGELEVADASTLSPSEKVEREKKMNFLQKARWDVEKWYDVTMKAYKDHYERRMKMWSFAFGAIVVVWLNANVFEIYKEFSTNKVLRDSAVKLGEKLASIPKDSLIVVKSTSGQDSANYVPDSLAFKSVQTHITYIDSMVNAQSFQIFRWNTATGSAMHWAGFGGTFALIAKAVWRNIFGWLAMTLLVGLGAPFWYDVLKSIVGIKERLRGTVQGKSNEGAEIEARKPEPMGTGQVPTYG